MDNGKRLLWLDFVKGIAMISVVFCHLAFEVKGTFVECAYTVLGAFMIPSFFAASGFLYKKTKGIQFVGLCKRIYIPLFVFSFFPILFLKYVITGDLQTAIVLLTSFLYSCVNWFLGTFLIATLVFRFLVKYLPNRNFRLLVSILIFFVGLGIKDYNWSNTINLNAVLVSQFFIIVGYEWRYYENKEDLGLLLSIILFFLFTTIGIECTPRLEINIGEGKYNNVGFACGYIISALLFTYNLAIRLHYKSFVEKLICKIGEYSIVIYIMHGTVIKYLRATIQINDGNVWAVFVNLLLSISICCILAFICEKHCPILLGITKKK